ncbi:MAG: DUF1800 domain-containing protein [Rubrivivax sp.]
MDTSTRSADHGADAATAAHRFGLGEASLDTVTPDPRAWLLAQIGPADAPADDLAGTAEALALIETVNRERRAQRAAPPPPTAITAAATSATAPPSRVAMTAAAEPAATDDARGERKPNDLERALRESVRDHLRAHLQTAATSRRPFSERLVLFWSNHFTVSMAKGSVRGLVGPFERDAIRPHIAGSFETLLKAAVTHPAMLRYLDNQQSAGPDSRVVQRLAQRARGTSTNGADGINGINGTNGGNNRPPRITGLNENLAREVLELHTLGVAEQDYTQADVTAFAAVLTGWRGATDAATMARGATASAFDPNWHQPGSKTVLGRSIPEGPHGLDAVLHTLALHPATARHIATKLARHFVADDPPPTLVARLAARFQSSGGDLAAVYCALIDSSEAWDPQPRKLKTPEELIISSARLLQVGDSAFKRIPDGGAAQLGQRLQLAPSPAGWPDRAEEWLGPDAVWKRVEWATRVADRAARGVDARALALQSLGPRLQETTARQIERAADGPQALALLLLAPEFQRR